MSFMQWLKDKLARGEEPTYIVRNVNKPPPTKRFKKRGIGWTRPYKKRLKKKRKMAQESCRRNRKR